MKVLVMDLEECEARSNCAGVGQQQFNRPTDRPTDRSQFFYEGAKFVAP
jgi:hypothetical protein